MKTRAIWIDLLALAGSGGYGDIGEIKLADNVGLTDNQISAILNLPHDEWLTTKERLLITERITTNGNNIIQICNWNKYQSEYQRQKPYRDKLQPEVTGDSYKEKEIEIEIEKRIYKINKENSFDLFWKEYPNKKAKQKALESWNKLNGSLLLVKKIIESLSMAKKSVEWTKDGGQFIPHPTTFLNQHRWEDEYSNKRSSCVFDSTKPCYFDCPGCEKAKKGEK